MTKVKGQEKLNRHIAIESVLMLFAKNYQNLVGARRKYSLPNLARFY